MANRSVQEKKGPMSSYTMPGTRVANRTEIFDDQPELSSGPSEAESQKLNRLMQQLMGTASPENDAADGSDEEEDTEHPPQAGQQEEEFTFRLFSSKPVAKVNISEKDEAAERLAELVAAATQQRSVEHDAETNADFIAQINAAAVSFDDIMAQSQWAYPALRLPHRVISAASPTDTAPPTQEKKQRRKSKKRRDFEKAVRQGRIVVAPNMRNPHTPGGWPGWPAQRSPCAIITSIEKQLKKKRGASSSFAPHRRGALGGRGGRGGNGSRGRGSGRGAMRGRGR